MEPPNNSLPTLEQLQNWARQSGEPAKIITPVDPNDSSPGLVPPKTIIPVSPAAATRTVDDRLKRLEALASIVD